MAEYGFPEPTYLAWIARSGASSRPLVEKALFGVQLQKVSLTGSTSWAARATVAASTATAWPVRTRVEVTKATSWKVAPPAVPLPITEDFSSGTWATRWTDVSYGLAQLNVVDGWGELRTPGGQYATPRAGLSMVPVVDQGVVLKVQANASNSWVVSLRAIEFVNSLSADPRNGASLYFVGGIWGVRAHHNGEVTFVSYHGGPSVGLDRWVRFEVTGTLARAKVWQDGAPEPATWDYRELLGYSQGQPIHTDPGTIWLAADISDTPKTVRVDDLQAYVPLGFVTASTATSWRADGRVTVATATSWHATGRVTSFPGSDALWVDTEPWVDADLWHVFGHSWAVLTSVQTTSATAWAVRTSVQATSATSWPVRTRVEVTQASSWHVNGVPGPKISTLVADFDSGVDARFELTGGVVYANGAVGLRADLDYSSIRTGFIYDLHDSSVSAEWSLPAGLLAHPQRDFGFYLYDEGSRNRAGIGAWRDEVVLSTNEGMSTRADFIVTPTQIWRLRESAGALYFEARPDRESSWETVLTLSSDGVDLGRMLVSFYVGADGVASGDAEYVYLDNINHDPRVQASVSTSWHVNAVPGPKFEMLVADFDSGADARFQLYGASYVGGTVRLPANWSYPEIRSVNRFDLRDSAVTVQWTYPVDGYRDDQDDDIGLYLYDGPDYRNQVFVYRNSESTLALQVNAHGALVVNRVVTFDDPASTRIWRLRESAGTLYFEAKPDHASPWVEYAAEPTQGDLGLLRFAAYGGRIGTGPAQDGGLYFELDNINHDPRVQTSVQSSWHVRPVPIPLPIAESFSTPGRWDQSKWYDSGLTVDGALNASVVDGVGVLDWSQVISAMEPTGDQGVLVRVVQDPAPSTTWAINLRMDRYDEDVLFTDPLNGLQLYVGNRYADGYVLRDGAYTNVSMGGITLPLAPYWLRVQAIDDVFRVRVWNEGTQEPADWVEAVVPAPVPAVGVVGFAAHGGVTYDTVEGGEDGLRLDDVLIEAVASVQAATSTAWPVRTAVQIESPTLWASAEQVTLSVQALWNVTELAAVIELVQPTGWAVFEGAELARATAWHTSGQAVLAQGASWRVGEQVTAQALTAYGVQGYTARATLYLWKAGVEIPVRATRVRAGTETPIALPVR